MHSNGDVQSSHEAADRELNWNKESFDDIYNETTPLGYYKTLSALGYGEYHDRVTHLINNTQPDLRSGVRKVIDIGCLYGSSTISYAQGAMWSQSMQPEAIRDLEITGVDISENALQFGLKSGVFAKIVNQNLNEPLSAAFYDALDNADTLLCMMALSYVRDGVFEEVIKRFAANGGKFAIYSTIPVFDDRCYSPEALGLQVKWSKSVVFRHRLLTDTEIKANGGVTMSFTRIYLVEF